MQKSIVLKQPNPWKPWIIASIASIVILAVSLGTMYALGLFEIPTDDPGAKTIAAALALVGTLLATVVTLVGTILKYSIDERNAQREVLESNRAHSLAIGAEQRNRIEIAIRAVELLGENNKDATPHQIGGAILALVSLNELELAVSLLSELWPAGLASRAVADAVLSKALKSPSPSISTSAAVILLTNVEHITDKDHTIYFWPIENLGWNVDLSHDVRLMLVLSAVEWMKMSILKKGKIIPEATVVLFKALEDPDSIIKEIACSALRPLTKTLSQKIYLQIGELRLSIADIAGRLTAFPEYQTSPYAATAMQEIQETLKKAKTTNEP